MRLSRLLVVVSMITWLFIPCVRAQEMEPRAYSNAPIGMNFLVLGYGYSEGSLLFDPAIPIQNASAGVNAGVVGLAHVFDLGGQCAKFALVLPYVRMNADGFLEGEYRQRTVDGTPGPAFGFSYNFVGAPALTFKDFSRYHQDLIVGAALKVTTPWGQYDSDRLINIGTNRWSFKSEFGISKALGRWIIEGSAAVSLFTPNDEFFGRQRLEQAPIYSVQSHVIFNFIPGLWAALDATYYTGGQTTVAGVPKDNRMENWRFGATLALPINRHHSINLSASSGIWTRTGTDFDAYHIAWQYRWGGGLEQP